MARKTFLGFFRDQRQVIPPVVKADLSGKTVVVVGANVGLGFEAAKHFATMNPERLILACRNQAKGDAAIASTFYLLLKPCISYSTMYLELEQETGYKKAELWIIDLTEFSSVKKFVDKFENEGGRLDILVENAGITIGEYQPTPDDWESTCTLHLLFLYFQMLI